MGFNGCDADDGIDEEGKLDENARNTNDMRRLLQTRHQTDRNELVGILFAPDPVGATVSILQNGCDVRMTNVI